MDAWMQVPLFFVLLATVITVGLFLCRRQEREIAESYSTAPTPMEWRIRSSLLAGEIESAQEIEWLLNVYRWNGEKVPPRDELPAYILDAYAQHEARKAYFTEQMAELEKMHK